MGTLNVAHTSGLAVTALVVGLLAIYMWRANRKWAEYDQRTRILASRITLMFALFSVLCAALLFAILIMNQLGMHSTVDSIADFLTRFEADLTS